MNDRHPSGTLTTPAPASDAASAHYAPYGTQEAQYGDSTTPPGHPANGFEAGFDTGAHATAPPTAFAADPLFGSLPGDPQGTGAYDATQWASGAHQTLNQDPYAAQHMTTYDSGSYDATAWVDGYQPLSAVPPQATPADGTGHGDGSGQWDATAWLPPEQSNAPTDATQHWEWGTQAFDTGAYDATQWNSGAQEQEQRTGSEYQQSATGEYGQRDSGEYQPQDSGEYGQRESAEYQQPDGGEYHHDDRHHDHHQHDDHHRQDESFHEQATATFDQVAYDDAAQEHHQDPHGQPRAAENELGSTGELPAVSLLDDQEEAAPAPGSRAAARTASRSRRRAPAKRSALMTVAIPSACVMGVAGIAAASVVTLSDDTKETAATAADAQPVKPSTANNQLDTQLASLSAEADDFADRASRTQERLDLAAQQEAEKKAAAEEAARLERLRPKFALPVAQSGLSAYFGQSGINWMSVHSGIDFPVAYGTPVLAATDGTIRTQVNAAYGTMVILTAMDGTETWYCHLSSYQVASGTTVKAGDPIAYSGDSGNSTGPHLHFEVRPGGGAAIDPLAWFRSHGLDPS
ncbi:M23 family metallopeptidase [Streptomyces sp. NPDC059477]|uniref:M23 family metallopeptidase n=1 Tax=Streptomyces sp. NPDC059477 TaxID=3346847 RepID=UPI0036BE4929